MHFHSISQSFRSKSVVLAVCLTLVVPLAGQNRDPIKPGWNLFSKEQDIQLGQEASAEIEKEVQVVDDKQLNDYVNAIGQRLAKGSQDPDYPFTFKVIADPNINAFALPGGPIYLNSGLIAQADNEAQLAGVIGHEIGHVVLRHSTNQASKASMFQLPAMLAAGVLGGGGGMLGQLAQVGIGFGLNSALLSYGRKAETQSDIVGARMLLAAGYNPTEMASFFQKLEDAGGASGPQFLSSHPNPGNRVKNVNEEIAGYPQRNFVTNTREFPRMKERAAKIKAAPKPAAAAEAAAPGASGSQGVSTNGLWRAGGYEFRHPQSWKAYPAEGEAVTILPDNGAVRTANGGTGIARGVMSGYFDSDDGLTKATSAMIEDLQKSNPGLNLVRDQRRTIRLAGERGESIFMEGPSPLQGQREYVWMVTAEQDRGLFYMIMIAPEREYDSLYPQFEEAVNSVKLDR